MNLILLKKEFIMADYLIVEPSFELYSPDEDTLLFLERCARTCYKSEDKIQERSAERLLGKIVKEYKHLSVTEHSNCIISFDYDYYTSNGYLMSLCSKVPLFANRISYRKSLRDSKEKNNVLLSGNLRMWMELVENGFFIEAASFTDRGILHCLHKRWPFFFKEVPITYQQENVCLLDSSPVTNSSGLLKSEMLKHMTLTGKFIGSRTMSHQLVRHRLGSNSQESQRYCNYGKKGFQFIIPPNIQDTKEFPARTNFVDSVLRSYGDYLLQIEFGSPPEDARFVLPNATKTEVVTTYTLAMWKHCIEHRGHNPHAQEEIRKLFLDAEQQINNLLGWEIL